MNRMAEDDLKKPSEMGISISEDFEKALMKGLAVFQKDRYKSIDELLEGLQGIESEGETVTYV